MEISGLLSPLAACAYLATSGFALIAAFRAPARRRDLALFNWFAVVVVVTLLHPTPVRPPILLLD